MLQRFWKWFLGLFIDTSDQWIYHPRQRVIYTFWDGEKERPIDPMPLYKKLMGKWQSMVIDYKVSQSESTDAPVAHTNLSKSIREIFEIKLFESGGLTETELIGLCEDFLAFTETVKKNSRISPTWLNNMEASKHSSKENLNTSNTMDSGSIAKEPSIVVSEPSH